MNTPLAQFHRWAAEQRGQSRSREIPPDPEAPIPEMTPHLVMNGCYSCYRTAKTIAMIGHVEGCWQIARDES